MGCLLLCYGILCVKLQVLSCNELSNSVVEISRTTFIFRRVHFADTNILFHFPDTFMHIMFICTSMYIISTQDFMGRGFRI